MDSGVVDQWYGSIREDYLTAYGTMPSSVKATLSEPWSRQCATSSQDLVGVSLIALEVENSNYYKVLCPLDLRLTEIQAFFPKLMTASQEFYLVFYFDMRPFNRTTALFGLSNTVFVMILLVTASLMFTNDANRLVLRPVEKMIGRIEAIRDKPLLAMKMADDEFKAEEIAKERLQRQKQKPWNRVMMERGDGPADAKVMETVILEKTIIKLGSLLALGFGEAGADIIGKNMSGSDSAGVNAMVPGRKCECIVGVMRVRDFSTATEVLQSKVMMFSNQIAEIVHGVCNEFHGAPNKNTGSIVSSAAVIGAVHRSPLLGSYREHPGLQYRLGSNCRVHLSIGLHKGWAIEGAVGSEFKIDCSYLSPNVSIATSIERSTEVYNVSVIVAQSVIDLVSYNMRCQCRLIDRVIIRGSPAPMELYCVDLDYKSLEVDLTARPKVPWNTRQRFKVRQWMEQEKNAVLQKDGQINLVFATDEVIAQMREAFTVEFFQLFNMGYQNYSQGEWQVARRMLMEIKSRLAPDDGPSTALLKFMEFPHDFDAPKESEEFPSKLNPGSFASILAQNLSPSHWAQAGIGACHLNVICSQENDKRACSEDSQGTIRKQRATIEKLTRENRKMKAELNETRSGSGTQAEAKMQQETIARLSEQKDTLQIKLENEANEAHRLQDKLDTTQRRIFELREDPIFDERIL
eukprot:g2336.t1